jgi:hypothetical protein
MELSTKLSDGFFRAFCPNPTQIYDLGRLYNELNFRFFRGELPTLQEVRKIDKQGTERVSYPSLKWEGRFKKVLGMYHPSPKRGTGVIRISRKLASDPTGLRSTLLHEMLHKYLDLKGLDDGIKGHGKNFILHAKGINEICKSRGFKYRIHFYEEEILQEAPSFKTSLLGEEIHVIKDLDVARTMKRIFGVAFDEKFVYRQ